MKSRLGAGVDAHEGRYFVWWVSSGGSRSDGGGGGKGYLFFEKLSFSVTVVEVDCLGRGEFWAGRRCYLRLGWGFCGSGGGDGGG